MNKETAGCSHSRVIYEPQVCDGRDIRGEVVPGGARYDQWKCAGCGTLFIPAPSTPSSDVIRQMYEALSDLKRVIGPDGQFAVCRKDGEELFMPDQMLVGYVFKKIDALLSHPELKRYGGGK